MAKKLNCLTDFESNIMESSFHLKDALEQLNRIRIKVLFIEHDKEIVASLTDGDIRRAILSGANVDTEISKIANYKYTYLTIDDVDEARQLMTKREIKAIPIMNENKEIVKIYTDVNIRNKRALFNIDIPTVIMAGGKGTRLYPYTKVLPKPLIPIADIPIVERIIQLFQKEGCDTFHMIVNYKKDMIKSYFRDEKEHYNIQFWDEEKPLGTGGGLYLLKGTINQTFILTNCDIIIMEDVSKIVEHHQKEGNCVTMVCSLKKFEIPYGVVNFKEGGEISSFEEKPTFSFFTNTGYYILEPDILSYIQDEEVVGMPEIIDRMRLDGKKVGIYPIGENAWLDMGQIDSMESMERRFRELNLE